MKELNFKYIIILIFLYVYLFINYFPNLYSIFARLITNKPKISVFIPIYNREDYISKCIQSLQNQTFKDIEIIAVNDFSNDSTLTILSHFAQKDHRIKIVNNDKNHGLLYSRAMGILNSTGEYVMNLDSDDELNDNECLEYLYNKSQIYQVDIIKYSVLFKSDNSIVKCSRKDRITIQPNLYNSLFTSDGFLRDYLIWNKIIKREIFLKAYESFKIAIYNGKWNYFEDDVWNILVHKHANSKLCVDKLIYIYNYNKNSLINKRTRIIEFQNLLYRHEMYKRLFSNKVEEKKLIAEYYFLVNRLKSQIFELLLLNDTSILKQIKDNFVYFINNYNCSIKKKKDIINFLKLIKVN